MDENSLFRFDISGLNRSDKAFSSALADAKAFARSFKSGMDESFKAASEAAKPFVKRFKQTIRELDQELEISDAFKEMVEDMIERPLLKARVVAHQMSKSVSRRFDEIGERAGSVKAKIDAKLAGPLSRVEAIARKTGDGMTRAFDKFLEVGDRIYDTLEPIRTPFAAAIIQARRFAHHASRPFKEAARAAVPFMKVSSQAFIVAGKHAARAGALVAMGFADRTTRAVGAMARGVLASVRGMARTIVSTGRMAGKAFAGAITLPIKALSSVKLYAFTQNVRSAVGAVRSIAGGMVDLVRDAGRSELALKSFASLTGSTAEEARVLAMSVQEAALGTISQTKALQIANRALASGMGLDQLLVAMEFISKKSATIGKDANQAIDTVITGLSRGSTLFLDDFGILVDGVESVKMQFESIKGIGAWDDLGPAAQKAVIVDTAIRDMKAQMQALGIEGDELAFVVDQMGATWQDIVGSAKQLLFAAPPIQQMFTNIRDQMADARTFIKANWDTLAEMGEVVSGAFMRVGQQLTGMSVPDIETEGLAAVTEMAASLPLYAMRFGLEIKQAALKFAEYMAMGLRNVVQALIVPVSSLVSHLAGEEEGIAAAEAMSAAAAELLRWEVNSFKAAKDVDKQLQQVDADLAAIIIKARDLNKTEEDLLDTRKSINFRNAMKSAFGSITGMAGRALKPILTDAEMLAKKFNAAGDSFERQIARAADKVKRTAQAMSDARRALEGHDIEADERRYRIRLAGASQFPWAERTMRFMRAKELFGRSQAEDMDAERRLDYLDRSADILEGLATDRTVMTDRRAMNQTLRLMETTLSARRDLLEGDVTKAEREHEQANMDRKMLNLQYARDFAKDRLQVFGQAAQEGKTALQDFTKAIREARREFSSNGQGGGGNQEMSVLGAIVKGLVGRAGGAS